MATTKRGTPKKKPVQKPGVAVTAAGVIRRPNVPAKPLPSATAAELRADREPAVSLTLGARRGGASPVNDHEDWAPPPQQHSWWERVAGTLWRHGEDPQQAREDMAEHMAAVKAGVLQELETMGVQKGIALKGSPFASVLLPVKPRKRRSWKWPLIVLLGVGLVGLMVWVGTRPASPDLILRQTVTAVRTHDIETLMERVNVANIATGVVNQLFNVPEEAGNPLASKLAVYAKPGLANGLKEDVLTAVGRGEVDPQTLLGRLWQAMGAENVRFEPARVAMQDDNLAVAEMPVVRNDLGLTLPLQVVLTRGREGYAGWHVVEMPNLGAVLGSIAAAETALAERRGPVMRMAAKDIRIEEVTKSSDSGANGVRVTVVVTNVGDTDARDVPMEIIFGDAAGRPMLAMRVTLDGVLAAGGRREQMWSIPVDRRNPVERAVADLPQSALTVVVSVAP